MVWQYRTILFEFTKDGLLGDRYVDDEEMEKTLNQLGQQAWELVNVSLLQDGLLAFLKRPVQDETVQVRAREREPHERVVEPPRPAEPVVPSLTPSILKEPRPAMPTRKSVVAEQVQIEERQSLRGPERQRRGGSDREEGDFIGGIKIS